MHVGYQAAPVLERLAKRIPAGQRFRPRIDVRVADAFVFRPGRDQAPAHELHRRLVSFVVNYRGKLCRRDVVTRREKRHARHDDANQFDQLAKIFRRRVSSAHGFEINREWCRSKKIFYDGLMEQVFDLHSLRDDALFNQSLHQHMKPFTRHLNRAWLEQWIFACFLDEPVV